MSADPGVVVVGAGLAGANVVQTLREEAYDGAVTLIGAESERPYERPGLSKEYLQGSADADSLFVHEAGWYDEHDVATRFGSRVTSIDPADHTVTLDGGETISYAKLVLATGSRPRLLDLPGADLDGVHALRTLSDSDDLRARITADSSWVIVGGGWIGLEVAAAVRHAGGSVVVLESQSLPLAGVLGEQLATYLTELHRSHGVDVRTEASVEAIEGAEGRVTGVRTSEGTVAADEVLIGVGAIPNTELAQDAGLGVDNGIVVDPQLHSSDPDILAAGDVAEAFDTATGRSLRVEHWDNAIRQGKLAAETILGHDAKYDWQPYFYTDQFDFGMEYVGHGSPDDTVTIRGSLDSGEFIAFWTDAAGVVTAAMNVNIWDVNDDLRAVVGREVPVARLADPDVPLTDL